MDDDVSVVSDVRWMVTSVRLSSSTTDLKKKKTGQSFFEISVVNCQPPTSFLVLLLDGGRQEPGDEVSSRQPMATFVKATSLGRCNVRDVADRTEEACDEYGGLFIVDYSWLARHCLDS